MLLKDIRDYSGIYVSCTFVDFRKSIDGLAHIVIQDFQMDPFGNYLYLFCNKNRTRLKVLHWDKNGYCLLYKRLDGRGARFAWPSNPAAVRGISVAQLELLLGGLSIDPPRGFGEVMARAF